MIKQSAYWEHLTDELELLNLYLLRGVRQQDVATEPTQLDGLHGLVVSEQEVLAILTSRSDELYAFDGDQELELKLKEIEERISRRRDDTGLEETLPLPHMTSIFNLERIEEQCIILCLAPEVDSKYSKVFAYLQDDATKKHPTVDLALKLFCKSLHERVAAHKIFSPNSTLIRNRILLLGDAYDGVNALSQRTLKLDERIAAFVLETPQLDACLRDWVEFVAPSNEYRRPRIPGGISGHTLRMVEACFSSGEAPIRPVIHLYGRQGSGRRSVAEFVCSNIGLPLLVANVKRLPPAGRERTEALWRFGRESLLLPAAMLVEHFDDLLQEGYNGELATLLDAIKEFTPITFLSGTQAWKTQMQEQLFINLECTVPASTDRVALWKERLERIEHEVCDEAVIELATKFNFTDGQIRNAIKAARDRAYWENQPPQAVTAGMLNQACRGVATPNLSGLARKIEAGFYWSDIVLPHAQLVQLREMSAHVVRAQMVLETWGFAQKLPYGRGITALFEGLSGTGKTMAAGIIAAELGLDLYKIDLSCVVSKYIGETEKNLNRIFTEAQDSNAILFFDEADALFGKRSEVKDAHDRYANIETSYLLQRMEEYDGIAILATNMRQNMDEAFIRRMRFVIHFPFPGDSDRELIWQKSFPADAPLGSDVDFGWLARKLKIAGGHIKNISLRAAFLATERQGVIGMDCLIDAAKREFEKLGRSLTLAEFRPRENAKSSLESVEVA